MYVLDTDPLDTVNYQVISKSAACPTVETLTTVRTNIVGGHQILNDSSFLKEHLVKGKIFWL